MIMADNDDVPGDTIHFKRQVLSRFEELGNISSVSREFGVPRQNIQSKDELKNRIRSGNVLIEVLLADG